MKYLITAMILALVAGCTTYGDVERFGGYTHTRVQENLYTVTYRGNVFTPFDEAHDLVLRRAKEIGRELGYKYMYVLGTNENSIAEDAGVSNGSYFIDVIGLKEPKYSIKVKYLFNHPKDKYLNEDIYKL